MPTFLHKPRLFQTKLLSGILFFGVIFLFGGMSLKINSCLMLFVIMESKIAFYTCVDPFIPCLYSSRTKLTWWHITVISLFFLNICPSHSAKYYWVNPLRKRIHFSESFDICGILKGVVSRGYGVFVFFWVWLISLCIDPSLIGVFWRVV